MSEPDTLLLLLPSSGVFNSSPRSRLLGRGADDIQEIHDPNVPTANQVSRFMAASRHCADLCRLCPSRVLLPNIQRLSTNILHTPFEVPSLYVTFRNSAWSLSVPGKLHQNSCGNCSHFCSLGCRCCYVVAVGLHCCVAIPLSRCFDRPCLRLLFRWCGATWAR